MITTLVAKSALAAAAYYADIADYVTVGDCIRFAAFHSPESIWRFIDTIPSNLPLTGYQQNHLVDCIEYLASEL